MTLILYYFGLDLRSTQYVAYPTQYVVSSTRYYRFIAFSLRSFSQPLSLQELSSLAPSSQEISLLF